MTNALPFKDKVVLVTGGSRGLGAEVARRFAALGADIAVGYRSDADSAARVVDDIKALGRRAEAVSGDVAKPDEAVAKVEKTISAFGRLDVLVNAAGVGPYLPLDKIDEDHYRKIFDANVLGTMMLTKAAAPHLPSPGGRIVHFASRLAQAPMAMTSVYSASKAAVVAFTRAISKELGPRGITVNAVAPGLIETDMTTDIIAERGEAVRAMTPLQRIGQPDDIAGIVTFLASEEAGWITGQTILADGGIT